MSRQPSNRNSKAEEYGRWRRRDHANIEAMQNLAVARIAAASSVEMPPNVRHLISALQGAHGGGEQAFEEFARDYLSVGTQLQFRGTDEAIRARVRRWVDDLLAWQRDTGVELFSVVKGGDIIGHQPDGTPIRSKTVFVDNLKPYADEAVQRARASELWRGNREKGIRPHPGKALAAQVEWLVKALPKLKPASNSDEGEKGSSKMSAGEYAQKREAAIVKAIEAAADGVEEREGDADLWLEKLERLVHRMRESRRKTAPARRSWIMLTDDDESASESEQGGSTAYMCNTQEPQTAAPDTARLGDKNVTQADAKIPEKTPFSEAENEPDALKWALEFASQDVRVFPLNSVFDGICSCPDGSECRSAGKHPLARLAPRGVKDATTDEATIRRWFGAEPLANLGVAMGGKLRLLAVDVDPRSGGDASLCDLVEAHGDAWLETFAVRTGSLGYHFLFRLPEGIEVHRGKLAPGIDLKAEGGYLVAPPSRHTSGRRYEVEKNVYIAEAPAWLVEELTRKQDEQPPAPVDFQAYRDRKPSAGSTVIVEGERNERLFKIGCAMWGKGEVMHRADLFQRMMETNLERVSPPLGSDEVWKLAESISSRYALGTPIREGAA